MCASALRSAPTGAQRRCVEPAVPQLAPPAPCESSDASFITGRSARAMERSRARSCVSLKTCAGANQEQPFVTRSSFDSLGLSEPLRRALDAVGYLTPTPIQAQAIPPLLEGRDLLGVAQTGTGKTAAFGLPLLQRLAGGRPAPGLPRALVLAPTRELALQIGD